MFPIWIGTKSNYNGTTEVPLQDTIACGYLVSTTLKHVGFNLNRYEMARTPSLKIIHSLTTPVSRYRDSAKHAVKGLEDVLIVAGQGLYIFGIDHHTGYLIYDNDAMNVFHSGASKVEIENIYSSYAIKYEAKQGIYPGKLFEDKLVIAWLTNNILPIGVSL